MAGIEGASMFFWRARKGRHFSFIIHTLVLGLFLCASHPKISAPTADSLPVQQNTILAPEDFVQSALNRAFRGDKGQNSPALLIIGVLADAVVRSASFLSTDYSQRPHRNIVVACFFIRSPPHSCSV
jgi:hypothetical protein